MEIKQRPMSPAPMALTMLDPPWPPFPRGYAVADSDPMLLEPVWRLAKLYREC